MAGPIVGRDAELATVGETLARTHDGIHVLLIEGEPGIGKTTVWQEGVAQASRLGYRVLSCRAARQRPACRSLVLAICLQRWSQKRTRGYRHRNASPSTAPCSARTRRSVPRTRSGPVSSAS